VLCKRSQRSLIKLQRCSYNHLQEFITMRSLYFLKMCMTTVRSLKSFVSSWSLSHNFDAVWDWEARCNNHHIWDDILLCFPLPKHGAFSVDHGTNHRKSALQALVLTRLTPQSTVTWVLSYPAAAWLVRFRLLLDWSESLKSLSHLVLLADCRTLMCLKLCLLEEDVHVVVLAVVNKLAWVLCEILYLALDAVILRPR